MKNIFEFPRNRELDTPAGPQMAALTFALAKLELTAAARNRRLTVDEIRRVKGLQAIYNDMLGRLWPAAKIDAIVDEVLKENERQAVRDAVALAAPTTPVDTTLPPTRDARSV